MMSHFLGDGTFRRGVTRYLKAHQFGNAAQDSLWACLEEQAQLDSDKGEKIYLFYTILLSSMTEELN